ncbi:MAG: proline iminopeptidase [Alphaproteobacteria bacterium]|jgi:proline iminopeptidase
MLYLEVTPYQTGYLDRGLHQIYFEKSGNENGVPIVFLHGGPGSGTQAWQRQFFDTKKFNIILLDQRGCGQSKPHACLEDNTTEHLVDDLHALKMHLGFDKWHVIGGSWGSTLALAYADKFADDILSIIMWGLFLCRERELFNLYYEGGVASQVFADGFDAYINILPKEDRSQPIAAYHKILNSDDKPLIKKALRAWKKWEVSISRLEMSAEDIEKSLACDEGVEAFSLIENHYFMNKGFIDGDALIKRIGAKLKDIPVHIVQGRYDMVCPFKTAYELHKNIPHSHLNIISNAGHSSKETASTAKIVKILNNLS